MQKKEEILKQLSNYEVKPPDFLSRNVLDKIHSIHSNEEKLEEKMQALQHYSSSPPQELYQRIITSLGLNKKAKVVSINKGWWAAAAVLLMGIAIWVLLPKQNISDEGLVQNTENPLPQAPPNTQITVHDSTINSNSVTKPATKKNNHSPGWATYKSPATGNNEFENFSVSSIFLDGASYQVKDKEYFTHLTSFEPDEVPSFVYRNSNEKVMLYVDNSTAITISPNMMKMMKKLYSTRSNGKPTRKAVRLKKRLNSWKKADEVYFDKNLDKNPMNPVDLGNFLLDK